MKQYTIEGKLATLNEHIAAERQHRFEGGRLKKDMTELVYWQMVGKEQVTAPCIVKFDWYISSNHDPDNIRFAAKYVLDGMVKAGVMPNDSQKWIMAFDGDYFHPCDAGAEKVIVTVREYPE